jgi:hypothetical protein
MPINMKLWRVIEESELKELPISSLKAEDILEDWIAKDSSLLGMELLIIGRQVTTDYGGRIDLLAIDRQGDITIIELKRDKTPRNIVAQVLDYASWIRLLSYKDFDSRAYEYFEQKKDLSSAFNEFFEEPIPENINIYHNMLIVASEFDDASQRIVEYLADEYKVNINAIFFSIFNDSQSKLVGRAWLMDPEDVQERSESRRQAPWSGFWFVNVGEGEHRNWEDNRKYGYIGAGQGQKYSDSLKKLAMGDPIFAYMKGLGYVGYGIVREPAKMIKDFIVQKEQKPLLDLKLTAPNARENSEDPLMSDWAVGVDWIKTFAREDARTYKGIFANQNIVCKLRNKQTIDYLMTQFDIHD